MTDKITLGSIASFQNDSTAAAQYNSNNALITVALNNTLSRDGTSPNQMLNTLDMNSFNIVNLPAPLTLNSPLRLSDLNKFISGGTISALPAGGTLNQVLGKNSSVDFDVSWRNPVAASIVVASGKTATFNNTLTFNGTDSTTLTFQGTDTYVGRATTDTLTNKTISGVSNTLTVLAGSQLSGQIPVANGGTGLGTLTAHSVLLGETTSNVAFATPSVANQVLTDNGASSDPSFKTMTSILDGAFSSFQGNILYRGASTWSALSPGTTGQLLATGGIAANPSWVTASGTGTVTSIVFGNGLSGGTITASGTVNNTGVVTVKKQTFTASGTYTPSTGMIYAMIECLGGGAGGGGTATSAANTSCAGGGGGAGSYSKILVTAASVGASKTVTVGAAGAGGAAGNNAGSNGGDTSVGVLCVGKGGTSGLGANGTTCGAPGLGGVAGTGDLTANGAPGFIGIATTTSCVGMSSAGGNSQWGGGTASGVGTAIVNGGTTASGFGAGGGGANTFNAAGAAAGCTGSPGIVYITEYCNQ